MNQPATFSLPHGYAPLKPSDVVLFDDKVVRCVACEANVGFSFMTASARVKAINESREAQYYMWTGMMAGETSINTSRFWFIRYVGDGSVRRIASISPVFSVPLPLP